jgi:hypothetical protein
MPAKASAVTVEFQGGTFGLELLGPGGGLNQWYVVYSADMAAFDDQVGAPGNWDTYINAIAFKVGVDVTAAIVTATTVDGGPGPWNPVQLSGWMSGSGLGCSSGSADAICADIEPGSAPLTAGHSYTWTLLITTAGGVPTVYGQPIRAEFVNATGDHSGLLSMTTAQVPEPTSMMLLGLGLFGASLVARKRR